MTLGQRLHRLRKQQGLSQEALAGKLSVTRQTISKWELDQSVPELGLLIRLCGLFGVTTDYLICGEGAEEPEKKHGRFQWGKVRRILYTAYVTLALLAACVCLICDYFTSPGLGWSWIVIASLTAGFLVLRPVLTAKERVLERTLAAVSLVPVPFLAVLAWLLGKPVIFTLGGCISLVGIGAMWGLYVIFRRFRGRWWRAAGFALLALVPVPIVITWLVSAFLPGSQVDLASDAFHAFIMLLLALGCFLAERRSRGKEPV